MKNYWILKGIKFFLFITVAITAFSYLTMLLWNWLMPALFNLSTINFWQALGIIALSKIIFGFGGGSGHWKHKREHYMKGKMEERLKHMTPEERDRFREEWKKKCGGWKYGGWEEENKSETEKIN